MVAPSFADIFRGNSVGAGLVTAQADEEDVAKLIEALAADPGARVVVDVAERTVAVPSAGLSVPFALPDYARWRLLEGLDDIGVTLRHADAIAEFEQRRPGWLPVSGPRAHVHRLTCLIVGGGGQRRLPRHLIALAHPQTHGDSR